MTTVLALDGTRVDLVPSTLNPGEFQPVTLGHIYVYDSGQSRVSFHRGVNSHDWFVWSEKRQQRLATYKTRRDLLAAYERSNNSDGAYRCAALSL